MESKLGATIRQRRHALGLTVGNLQQNWISAIIKLRLSRPLVDMRWVQSKSGYRR